MNDQLRRPNCPYCNSHQVVLDGVPSEQQAYECRGCSKGWGQRGGLGGHSFPPDQIGAAIHRYYTGLSARWAAKFVKKNVETKHTLLSPQTVLNWVCQHTDAAIEFIKQYKAPGGGKWWLWSQPLFLSNRMCWMVVDDKTGYILASRADPSMTEAGATEVFLDALASAVRPCDEVEYLRIWPEAKWAYRNLPEGAVRWAVREALPDKQVIEYAEGILPFSLEPVGTRILLAYQDVCKRFNRIKKEEDFQRYIAGWAITSNLFTKYRELSRRTPGQAAGVKVPIADWSDVVRLAANAYLPSSPTERARLERHRRGTQG